MKLIIEQAHDHMECLDNVRKAHGNDCMIVHSFKQPNSYCIIVAVESADVKTGAQVISSVVGKTTSQAIPGESKNGYGDATAPTVTTKTRATNDSKEHTTAEISPKMLGLARKLSALSEEEKRPTDKTIDVSQKEFEALSFSDVLSEVVSQSTSIENKTQPEVIKTSPSNNSEQLRSDAIFDVSEETTSHTTVPLSDSAMLFSSLMSHCIKMDTRENFVGT